MSLSYKILDFPKLPVRGQLFYPAGAAYEGGFTSGGARVSSPEPGGRSFLEIELSLQTNEINSPWSSWLMSKVNGDIFRVRLTVTPQLVPSALLQIKADGTPWNNNQPWNNDENWEGAAFSTIVAEALEGSTKLIVDMSTYGPILKHGHVFGVLSSAYMVDDISYAGNFATIITNPPLRKDVPINTTLKYRPDFIGSISNGSEFRAMYEASNNSTIKMSRIIMQEVIVQ